MSEQEALSDDSRLAVPSYVLCRRVGGETVLLNMDNEEYYGLEEVGSRLWELVESGTTFGGAVAVLLEEYEVERDALVEDLAVLLRELSLSGLVLIDAP